MSNRQIDSVEFHLLKRSTLGERLKFFRNELKKLQPKVDFTTTAIAKRIEISPQSITAIERGESKKPSFHLINQLTNEYGVPLESITDEFYEGEEKLFNIGHPISVEVDFDIEDIDDIEIITEPEKSLGILLYEKNEDNIRLLFNEEIGDISNDLDFVQLLSRFIYEIELHKCEGLSDLYQKQSPFERALNFFKVSETSNPYVSNDVIHTLIDQMKSYKGGNVDE
ncbi:helix-turn-helix domain-containing protein [Paraliobacillus ryukyuensis]|uniref:helix-turn-helix domain-containing protein n=1 Tax=Paraliobacillus ryukyuensis TaxID=200904 RepID=UPI0009A8808B|nr:helix-turn-helix transcriptional regulator [Paraliobacillus ryukyuensis]